MLRIQSSSGARTSGRSWGFTLIELLVVIAIIAILAAILFPVFAQAREKARQITCASNEKQLLLGILMYANDADEDFPGTIYAYGSGHAQAGTQFMNWEVAVQPYIKSGDSSVGYTERGSVVSGGVYSCPDSPLPGFPVYSPALDLMPCYWENTPNSSDVNHEATSLEQVVTPDEKILLFENGANGTLQHTNIGMLTSSWFWFANANSNPALDTYPAATDPFYASKPYTDGGGADCDFPSTANASANGGGLGNGGWASCMYYPRWRHTLMSNMGFADGHVKAMRKFSVDWYTNVYNAPTFNAYAPSCGLGCGKGF